ncbi:hypothetical protein ACOMHN_049218 [Nucella lapillus]
MTVHWLCTLMKTSSASQIALQGPVKRSGLTISLGKTKTLFQPSPSGAASSPPPPVVITNIEIKAGDRFCCLGSTVSSKGSLDAELMLRISHANSAVSQLSQVVKGLPRRDRVQTPVLCGVRTDAGPRVKRDSNLASSKVNSGYEALGSLEARWPLEGWSVVLKVRYFRQQVEVKVPLEWRGL